MGPCNNLYVIHSFRVEYPFSIDEYALPFSAQRAKGCKTSSTVMEYLYLTSQADIASMFWFSMHNLFNPLMYSPCSLALVVGKA